MLADCTPMPRWTVFVAATAGSGGVGGGSQTVVLDTVTPDMTVHAAMQQALWLTGLHAADAAAHRLVYRGVAMHPACMLAAYNVGPGDTLFLAESDGPAAGAARVGQAGRRAGIELYSGDALANTAAAFRQYVANKPQQQLPTADDKDNDDDHTCSDLLLQARPANKMSRSLWDA